MDIMKENRRIPCLTDLISGAVRGLTNRAEVLHCRNRPGYRLVQVAAARDVRARFPLLNMKEELHIGA
ncbi:MAG: hypothetical protein ACLTDV_06805 [Eubacterium sp.]